jgi:TIR domain
MSASGGIGEPPACDLRIFINYRRDDAPMAAGRLSDDLGRHFGDDRVFMDVDKIEPGMDFKEAINRGVGACDVFIAVIGNDWLTMRDATGRRRLDNPDDYVRLEIEAALKRDVRVIPALVQGATMPGSDDLPPSLAPLATRNCVQLGDGVRWRSDVAGLMRALERIQPPSTPDPIPEPVEQPRSWSKVRPEGRPPEKRLAGVDKPWTKRWVLALAAALLVAAAVAGILVTRGSGGAQHMGGSAMSGAFPDAIESELLLAHIPSTLRASCHRTPSVARQVFLRTVRCAQGGGTVLYSRAHSSQALLQAFRQKADAAGVNYPTKSSCKDRVPSAGEWQRAGMQTHLEQRSSHADGRVLCYRTPSASWIVWTDNPTKILGEASRPPKDGAALYSWWRNTAGPETELSMSGGMTAMTAYPDAIERELLLDHIPSTIRKTCRRSNAFEHKTFLRAVECGQGAGDAKVEYMYAHASTGLKAYSNVQMTAAGLQLPSGGQCATSSDAANWWYLSDGAHTEGHSHKALGRVLCWRSTDKETIEWTDNSTGIYASASRAPGKRQQLYDWWQMKAGPNALEMLSMPGG